MLCDQSIRYHKALVTPDEQQPDSHPAIFKDIAGLDVQKSALRCSDSAGPSLEDTCACTAFKKTSTELGNALESLARWLCTEYVTPEDLSAFTSYRLTSVQEYVQLVLLRWPDVSFERQSCQW